MVDTSDEKSFVPDVAKKVPKVVVFDPKVVISCYRSIGVKLHKSIMKNWAYVSLHFSRNFLCRSFKSVLTAVASALHTFLCKLTEKRRD